MVIASLTGAVMEKSIFKYKKQFALFCILLSLFTWAMDFYSIVLPCPYCRVERAIIGLLGVMLLFPVNQYFLLKMLYYQLGFLGSVLSSQQFFLTIEKGSSISSYMIMSYGALAIIILEVYLLKGGDGSKSGSDPFLKN